MHFSCSNGWVSLFIHSDSHNVFFLDCFLHAPSVSWSFTGGRSDPRTSINAPTPRCWSAPPLRLDDKQEGGVSAWALPSPAVSLQSTGSLGVCVALIREAALNLTVTPALRSVAQTKVHLRLLKSQDKETVGHRCRCCHTGARAFIPGWMIPTIGSCI